MGYARSSYEKRRERRNSQAYRKDHSDLEEDTPISNGIKKPTKENISLRVSTHAIDRYYDGVNDACKNSRSRREISQIVQDAFQRSLQFLPDYIPIGLHHYVELKDPKTLESFGSYPLVLGISKHPGYDFVAITINPE
jgi:hypothetical protein